MDPRARVAPARTARSRGGGVAHDQHLLAAGHHPINRITCGKIGQERWWFHFSLASVGSLPFEGSPGFSLLSLLGTKFGEEPSNGTKRGQRCFIQCIAVLLVLERKGA